MRVSKKIFEHLLITLVIGIVSALWIKMLPGTQDGIKQAVIVQFVAFIICIVYFIRSNHNVITPYVIFMVIFYLFQNGQLLLYSIGAEYDYFYVERYSQQVVLDSVYYSTTCMCAAFAAGIFSMRREFTSKLFRRMNNFSQIELFGFAKIGYLLSALFALPNLAFKFLNVIQSGYFSVIAYVANIPSLVRVMEEFFVAFSIMLIIYGKKNKKWTYIVTMLFILWSVLTALTGQRSTGIAGIAIIGILYFRGVYDTKKISFSNFFKNAKKYMGLILVTIIATYLVSLAFSFRMQSSFTLVSISEAVKYMIGTLGFSFFPLILVMQVTPLNQPYLYGKSLLGSLVSGFVPETLDVFGLFEVFREWTFEPSEWIESYYSYGFGIDFSLNAETYVNFGYWGWIAMFLLCAIIASLLKNIDFSKKNNLFSQYSVATLLFMWFTLPRRKSYYIYNRFFWFVLVMSCFLIVMKYLFSNKGKN